MNTIDSHCGSDAVETALARIATGQPVVVVDDEDRENEGDLIFAAELASPALMAFMVRHSSGFVCVALPTEECDRLRLPPMHHTNTDTFRTAYRVTVDAADGVSTGISARDRAHTARLLSWPSTQPSDFTRPGHLVPLAARPEGVLKRRGHTEAAVDLTRLAGLRPAGVLCEVVSSRQPGQMARRDELVDFAEGHDLPMVSIAELADYRRKLEQQVERVAETRIPTEMGHLDMVGYRATHDGTEHFALVAGDVANHDNVPVHLHVECLLGDVFGSRRCDCSNRLEAAMYEITADALGVVIYLRPGDRHPSHSLQEQRSGMDRVSPCEQTDDNALTEHIVRDLGVKSIRHLHTSRSLRVVLDHLATVTDEHALPSDEVA